MREDIEFCRGVVEAKGHAFLVLDQTRPDIGLSVAKVIVPGLADCLARFGCPRLYQAPVDLGW